MALGNFLRNLIPKINIIIYLNNKNIPVYGKGINEREWIYVDDHCEAFIIKFFKMGKIGQSYNIGSGKNSKKLRDL